MHAWLFTCRGVLSLEGTKVAKLQAYVSSMELMKLAANCWNCWGSLLLIISTSPPSHNLSTHWETIESSFVIPFKLPSKPRSCNIQQAVRVLTINLVYPFRIIYVKLGLSKSICDYTIYGSVLLSFFFFFCFWSISF